MKILQTTAFLVCSQVLLAQVNWTFVKGDNTRDQPGIYGTQGIAASTNKPGGRYGSVSWTDSDGNFWLFGGNGHTNSMTDGALNDLWKYNTSTNEWTWVKGDNILNQTGVYGIAGMSSPTNKPGGKELSVSWIDGNGNFWLFGGIERSGGLGSGPSNDLWKYNPTINEWTWMKGNNIPNQLGIYGVQGISASTNNPGGRYGSVSWIDANGNLWLFGGTGYDGFSFGNSLNDLWKYNPNTNEWTWIKGDNPSHNQIGVYGIMGVAAITNKPGSRESGSVSWTDGYGNFWLFGGTGSDANSPGGGPMNDLWKYNPTTNEWTWMKGDNVCCQFGVFGTQGVSAAINKPGSMDRPVSWKDDTGNLWLFGGSGFAGTGTCITGLLNDLWKYNPNTNEWTWMNGDANHPYNPTHCPNGILIGTDNPSFRIMGVTWVDGAGNYWLFGGLGSSVDNQNGATGDLNDLWKFNVCQMNVSLGDDKYVLYGGLGYTGCGTLTPTITNGTAPFTYSWTSNDASVNGSTSASITSCNTNEVVRNYSVMVTDANGCTASASVNLTFVNISCSNNSNAVKIKVCHTQPGTANNCNTICISANAAQALLNNGSYLGECLPLCATPEIATPSRQPQVVTSIDNSVFDVHLYPNPSSNQFKLILNRQSTEEIEIAVYDILGRGVKKIIKTEGQQVIYFGEDLQAGIYVAHIRQGQYSKVIKFVKQ